MAEDKMLALKEVSTSLADVLRHCTGLESTREGFDAFYGQLRSKIMPQPEQSVRLLCSAITTIKKHHTDYVLAIAKETAKTIKYSEPLRETLEAIFYLKPEDYAQTLSVTEKEFLGFLLILHIRNMEAGFYGPSNASGF